MDRFYIGGDVGYAFGKDSAVAYTARGVAVAAAETGQHNGVIGGGHIGYNFSTQSLPLLSGLGGAFGGGLVVGFEADITGSDYRGHVGTDPASGNSAIETKTPVQGSFRGRVGIAADRALFFVTGGAAVAEFTDTYQFNPLVPFQSSSHDRIGYTVGGGVEYALTTNWSLRGEYRYSDFGTFRDQVFIPGITVGQASQHNIMQRVTVGFSYKFESPMAAPVVARY